MDLSKKRPKTLAKLLETAESHRNSRMDAIFSAALHGHEKCQDIMTRLGESSCEVISWRVAQAAVDEIRDEARRRYGHAVTFDSLWVNFLNSVRV